MDEHAHHMRDQHHGVLWAQWLVIGLGAWLASSPAILGYGFVPVVDPEVARVTAERGLPEAELRNLLMAWSDFVSGVLIMIFGALALSQRHAWARWANTAVALWLLFAPILLWVPSAAAYANTTLIAMLVIGFSILLPMMPGMSHEAMMRGPDVPPGWDYCPSTYLQRLPIIVFALIGLLLARHLAAYQLGHMPFVWDPFFGEGSERIVTSDVSKAFPVSDAALGALAYTLELLMAIMGGKRRWRTMPWMVLAFGIVVIPLGLVHIVFIIIQPIVIGTWCTVCLLAALAMLLMIPYAVDEVVAMLQFMRRAVRQGDPFWRTFFRGGVIKGEAQDTSGGFTVPVRRQVAHAVQGVSVNGWLLGAIAVGLWLMFTRLIYGTEPPMADSDHLVGALVVTFSVIALAEVTRAVRWLNLPLGVWLIAAPLMLEGAGGTGAQLGGVVAGALIIVLSLPRGPVRQSYGGFERYIR